MNNFNVDLINKDEKLHCKDIKNPWNFYKNNINLRQLILLKVELNCFKTKYICISECEGENRNIFMNIRNDDERSYIKLSGEEAMSLS